ncbi:MAG TPA: hypothetical protein DCX04_02170, partial [Halomonas sp.]|nr:hypothetical protein [Halomonas sp.]
SQDQLRDLEQRIARLQAEGQRRRQQRGELADMTALQNEHAEYQARLEEADQRADAFQVEREQWQQRYSDAKSAYQQAVT